MKKYKHIRVKIIKCDSYEGWYRKNIGEWFEVKSYFNKNIIVYDLLNTRNNLLKMGVKNAKPFLIMKDDAITLNEERKNKLNKINK